jgi:hypothetical protein
MQHRSEYDLRIRQDQPLVLIGIVKPAEQILDDVERSRSEGLPRATTRVSRGLKCWTTRLIVPSFYNVPYPERIRVDALQSCAIHIHAISLFGVVDEH